MGKKTQTAMALVLSAVGAGLVYVGYNNYSSVSADNPYAVKNPTSLVFLIIIGVVLLALGILMAIFALKSKKKNAK